MLRDSEATTCKDRNTFLSVFSMLNYWHNFIVCNVKDL